MGPAARPPAPSHIAAFRRARASRDPGRVAAKLNAWPGLLPLLLKAVRLTLAATKEAQWPEHLRGAAVGTRLSQGGPAGAGRSDGRSSAAQVVIERMQEGVQTSLSDLSRAKTPHPPGAQAAEAQVNQKLGGTL